MSGEFSDLSTEDRRKLLRLVCSFAWVDHDVDPDERKFILKLIERMDLSELDRRDAIAWLDCTQHAKLAAGSHTIYVGEVQASALPRPDAEPLLYWNRDYRTLALD